GDRRPGRAARLLLRAAAAAATGGERDAAERDPGAEQEAAPGRGGGREPVDTRAQAVAQLGPLLELRGHRGELALGDLDGIVVVRGAHFTAPSLAGRAWSVLMNVSGNPTLP